MCKTLGITPKELGEKRKENPYGIYFLEMSIIEEYNRKAEANKRAKAKAKRHGHI